MHSQVLRALRCPHCRESFEESTSGLACRRGHRFDRARQGYVNLLPSRVSRVGDSPEMLDARSEFLAAGHYEPLARTIATLGAEGAGPGLAAEVGAGTAYYLAALADWLDAPCALAMDLSKAAAKRAARAHLRVDSIVADTAARLPLGDESVGVLLNIFSPRNGGEFRRVLHPRGVLIVARAGARHLASLREGLGLLQVDPHKEARLSKAFDPHFDRIHSRCLTWTLSLPRGDLRRLAAMGPSARHASAAEHAARIEELSDPLEVGAEVWLDLYRAKP